MIILYRNEVSKSPLELRGTSGSRSNQSLPRSGLARFGANVWAQNHPLSLRVGRVCELKVYYRCASVSCAGMSQCAVSRRQDDRVPKGPLSAFWVLARDEIYFRAQIRGRL